MFIYLLKFSACLAIFMVFYKLFLERENMHHIKRYYLLAALVLSIGIPFVTFVQYIEPTIIKTIVQPMDNFESYLDYQNIPEPTNYVPIILWSIYGLGFLVYGLKFSVNLLHIFKKIRLNPKYSNQGFVNVLLTDLITPHTFFSYIFLNKHKYEAQEIPQEVFIHEQTHARQKHSIDVLFIEILQAVFWFNPLLYFIKKDVKLNHEFLADQAVLKNGIQPSAYQTLLLAFSSSAQHVELANAINYSSIKKRFTVMKTHTSKQKIWLRSFLLLPLIALTLYGFSDTKIIEKELIPLKQNESIVIEGKPILEISENHDGLILNGLPTSLLNLKEDFIKMTNNKKVDLILKSENEIDMKFVNEILTILDGQVSKLLFESKNVTNSIQLVDGTPTLLVFQQEPLQLKLNGKLTSLKDLKNDFMELTNGNISDLNLESKETVNMSLLDTISKLLKPELSTITIKSDYGITDNRPRDTSKKITGFEKNTPLLRFSNGIGAVCNNCTIEKGMIATSTIVASNEEKVLSFKTKFPSQKIVSNEGNSFNNETLKLVDLINDNQSIQIFDIKTKTGIIDAQMLVSFKSKQQKATPEEVAEYNKLAKHYNSQTPKNSRVTQKDVQRIAFLYNKMDKEQKANAEPFPNFPPPPPPPAPETGFTEVNGETLFYVKYVPIEYYNKKGYKVDENGKTINGNKQVNASDVLPGQYITKIYQNDKVVVEFKDNGSENVPPPPPPSFSPEYDNGDNVPPPPPPAAPKSPIEHVKEMSKKGATFYYENKMISSDEAIDLLKRNIELNIQTKQTDSQNPKVYLSKEPIVIKE